MMIRMFSLACAWLCWRPLSASPAQTRSAAPLRVGIVGLVHGHAGGFLGGGALVPAGAALHRPDIQVVGIAEPQRALFDRYAKRLGLDNSLYFSNLDEMITRAHPQAVLVFTNTFDHTAVVKQACKARRARHDGKTASGQLPRRARDGGCCAIGTHPCSG